MKLQRLAGALIAAVILAAAPVRAAEQASYVTPGAGPMSMATFVTTYLNPALRAIAACHNGASAPANGPGSAPMAYQCWVDTTANPALYKIYDGASWITLGAINTSSHTWAPYVTGGVSGGVPYFATSNLMGTSALLAQYGFMVGGGAGAAPATIAACTDDQIAFGRTSNNPLCRTITGDVTFSAGVSAIGTNKVTNGMIRQSGALSLIGRSANSTGNVADIQATAASDCVYRESGSAVGCGTVATGGIAGNAVTNAKLATMAANTTKCNATAGSAAPTDCDASTMRTNIGAVIGTNVEAWDTDLDCLAGLSSTGIIKRTGAGTCSAGTVALSDLATGTQDTVIGYFGSTAASALAINNCSNALTYSTSTHTFGCNVTAGTGTVTSAQIAAGTGISVSGTCTITSTGTCTVAQSLTNVTLNNTAGSPTGTTSGSGVMMGIGASCKITPAYSGRIMVTLYGAASNTGAGNQTSINLRYGSGAPPSNGAAGTGTLLTSTISPLHSSTNQVLPFSLSGIITGASPGTQYWIDLGVSATAGTSTINGPGCTMMEF